MFCQNCGTKNDEDAIYCEKCGLKLIKKPENSNKNILIIILIVILVIASLAGLFIFLSNNSNSDVSQNNVPSMGSDENLRNVENSNHPKTWNQINSYSGVSDYTTGVNIKGDKIKVEFSAFPIKNYADNHMKVDVYKDGKYLDSSSVSWNGKSAVATRSNNIELSYGPGNYQIYVDGYELVSWNMVVYEWS
ncbi:MAG: zinc ribbon domain-containing protein [Methanobacteriaceae archaeon]|jgi:predicted nucleic acid-binding Zn ribbon protein|nr:zinc ribbon domain-containing protein [Methanobacteriaceae archaeon]